MFKKTLLALAIAGVAVSANASVLNVATPITYSVEGSSSTESFATNETVVTLNAEYSAGDIITFTFTGASLEKSSAPTLVGSAADLTFGLLNSTSNSVTFRVTQDATVDTKASTITLSGIVLDSAAKTTVAYAAETSTGIEIDSMDAEKKDVTNHTLISSKAQFSATLGDGEEVAENASFDAIIDVDPSDSGSRTLFDSDVNDVLEVTFASASLTNSATATAAETVVNGNWSFLDADAEKDGVQLDSDVVSVTGGSFVYAEDSSDTLADATQLVVANDVTGGVISGLSLTIEPSGDVVIPAQSMTVSSTVAYSDAEAKEGEKTLLNSAEAGEWALNGADVHVPYMPYGSSITQILYVTNTSALPGDVSVTAIDEDGMKYDLGVVAEAGEGVTKITKQVADKLAEEGFTSGKLSLNIVVNSPSDNITVYASYNVGGTDRGFVPTK